MFKLDRTDRLGRSGASAARAAAAPAVKGASAWRQRLSMGCPSPAGEPHAGMSGLVESLLPMRGNRAFEWARPLGRSSLRAARYVGRAVRLDFRFPLPTNQGSS